jgi:crossover junction endodeoxyribonuclease RuvC
LGWRRVSISFCGIRRYACAMTNLTNRAPIRIIGIDPGLRRTGWGVIEIDGNRLIYIGCGSVEPPDTLPI